MQAGDKIRVQIYMGGKPAWTEDFTIEEFRFCLGIFRSEEHRLAQQFTPLCELYEPAPDAVHGYIPNFGPYCSAYVPAFMNLPK